VSSHRTSPDNPFHRSSTVPPCHQWTRKIDGKTATVNLTDEQLERYGMWFTEAQRPRGLLNDLEDLSLRLRGAGRRLGSTKITLKQSRDVRNVG